MTESNELKELQNLALFNLAQGFNKAMQALGEDILDELDCDQIEALEKLRTDIKVAIAAYQPDLLETIKLFELY